MLLSLQGYEAWLYEQGYQYDVRFYFRGEIIGPNHRLTHFHNVLEGEVVKASIKHIIIFQYVGNRVDR